MLQLLRGFLGPRLCAFARANGWLCTIPAGAVPSCGPWLMSKVGLISKSVYIASEIVRSGREQRRRQRVLHRLTHSVHHTFSEDAMVTTYDVLLSCAAEVAHTMTGIEERTSDSDGRRVPKVRSILGCHSLCFSRCFAPSGLLPAACTHSCSIRSMRCVNV